MKQTYYHGTSMDNFEDIMAEGIQSVSKKLWTDSYHNKVYLWSVKALADMEYNGSLQRGDSYAQFQARQNGAVACIHAKDKRIAVFKIVMSDKYVDPDSSSANMEGQGAVQTDEVKPASITEWWISEDISLLVPFLARNYYHESSSPAIPCTKLMEHVIKNMGETDSYIGLIDELPISWTHDKRPADTNKARTRRAIP